MNDSRDPLAGVDLDALRAKVERRLLDGKPKYTRHEVAQKAGMDVADTRRLWRALGFATVDDDDRLFTDGDVTTLQRTMALGELLGADMDELTAISRIFGQVFSRLASLESQVVIETVSVSPQLWRSAEDVARFVDRVVPVLEAVQSSVWRRQVAGYLDRLVAQREYQDSGETSAQVVGFADLSGFTTLTRNATEAELRALLEGFEDQATIAVGAHRGRVVKTIGDEVLFVADRPKAAAEIALELIDAADTDPSLPPLRIGMASGAVVERMGDVFGATVNIASRLTGLARPGTVLVDRELHDLLAGDDDYYLRARRSENVRGYAHLRSWRLQRAANTSGWDRVPMPAEIVERGADTVRSTVGSLADTLPGGGRRGGRRGESGPSA